MKRYNIKVNLSVNSANELLKKSIFLKDNIKKISDEYLNVSLTWLEERARYHLEQSIGKTGYVPTGELMSGFKKEVNGYVGRMFNDCFYSAMVEYGTGVVGSGTHPLPGVYAYDVNKHGDDGWLYMDKFGKFWWTKGMVAHRYMYDTVNDYYFGKEYKRIFAEAADKVIGGTIK